MEIGALQTKAKIWNYWKQKKMKKNGKNDIGNGNRKN